MMVHFDPVLVTCVAGEAACRGILGSYALTRDTCANCADPVTLSGWWASRGHQPEQGRGSRGAGGANAPPTFWPVAPRREYAPPTFPRVKS